MVFDPESIVKKAIDNNFDASLFSAIDDSDIAKAPNWLEWCLGKNFLNMQEVLPRQVQIATVLFGEYCPRCSKPNFIHDLFKQTISDIRENVTLLEFGVCPKCKVTQTELYISKEIGEYGELNAVIGRRGGKSALVSLMASYHLHRVVTLPSPSKYYGIIENDTLSFVFLAVTAKQARETLWDKFTARIDSSVWFKQYHKLLDDIAKKKGIKSGDIYKYENSYLTYFHKAIHCSYYTPDTTTLRGLTTLCYAVDELAYFDFEAGRNKIRANAEETYGSVDVSNQTIRQSVRNLRHEMKLNWVPPAIGLNISSPFSTEDMIMQLLKTAKDRPNSLAYHIETWNANPKFTRQSLWDETLDKKKFQRDYACIPTIGGDNVFLAEKSLVERCISKDRKNLFGITNHTFRDDTADGLMTVYSQVHIRTPDRTTPRILGVDVGYSNNSFALTMCSYNSLTNVINVDGVLECEPIKTGGSVTPINTFLMYEKAIVPILEAYNIIYVVYDQWQSLDVIQKIRSKHKVQAEEYSLKYDDFNNIIKSTVYEGKLSLPVPEVSLDRLQKFRLEDVIKPDTPVTNLHYQMLTVQEVGKKITKPYKGNDDIFRAMSLCIKYIRDPLLTPKFISMLVNPQGRGGQRALGSVHLYSSQQAGFGTTNTANQWGKKPVVNYVGVTGHSRKRGEPT